MLIKNDMAGMTVFHVFSLPPADTGLVILRRSLAADITARSARGEEGWS